MNHPIHRIVVLALLSFGLVGISASSSAEDFDVTKEKIEAALAADGRPEKDIARDKNRKPVETLEFFGLRDDMKVVELIPGGGWYTRVLAPVLAENGQLYVALGAARVSEQVLTEPGFEWVERLDTTANIHRPEGSRFYVIEDFKFGVSDLDMVLTFRNLHNFDTDSRVRMNGEVFNALKPGGLYGVVDHTARHMEPANHENRRRVDPVMIIKEMLDQGFELVDYTDLHYRADDELVFEVGRRSVTGNTDRFTLLFR